MPLPEEMKSPHLLLIFYKFLIFVLISFPLSYSNNVDLFKTCATTTIHYNCGSIQGIRYPFWGGNVPEYCGHPAFHLYCPSTLPIICIKEQNFSVLNINESNYRMSISPCNLWNPCPDGGDALHPYQTLNHSNFYYAETVRNLTLVYGCPMFPSLLKYRFTCDGGSPSLETSYNYYMDEITLANLKDYIEYCRMSVTVPVSEEAISDLRRNSMTLQQALSQSLDVEYFANRHNCTDCEDFLHGLCGSNITNHEFICMSLDDDTQNNGSSPEPRSDKEEGLNLKKLFLGIGFVVALVLSFCIITFSSWKLRQMRPSKQMAIPFCRMRDGSDKNIEMLIRQYEYITPKRYNSSDIKKMTNSFEVKLGDGGYGSVYKGKLADGRLVAVKMLKKSKGIGEEFINEVASISQTCHVNIVSLVGFCFHGCKRALVYEFMANGSLDKFLYNKNTSRACLGWKILHQIAIGIARGLDYLHQGCNNRILHLDIKPHNILLDEDFCPKIADFGLSKLCSRKQSIVSMTDARGTIGYIAPEVFSRTFGNVSYKSDVYSYGMMVLEMVSGRKNENVKDDHPSKNIYFPHWIYMCVKLGNDLGLCSVVTKEDDEIARKLVLVGLWCIHTNPSNRPSISEVLVMLEASNDALTIPPQPFHISPQHSDVEPSTISFL